MEALPDVLRHMSEWGFTKITPQPSVDWLIFVGKLQTCTQGEWGCEVWVDRSLVQHLRVRITQIPNHLPSLVPHLGPGGFLCYAAPGTEVVDIYNPVVQTRTSLLQAAHVLEQILAGELVEDLQEEFFVYWHGTYCIHDIERRSSGSLEVLQLSDNKMFILTDDAERSRRKFTRNDRIIKACKSQVALITSSVAPRPLQVNWPPTTVTQVLDWLGEMDAACRRKVRDKIFAAYRQKWGGIVIVIEAKKTGYSYGFLVHDLQRNRPDSKCANHQRVPIFDCPIEPLQMVRMDDKYLCERNIPGEVTLAGKRIGLIGCGTIGSFLGEMLMKAGGGSGGGEILLIDDDSLMPQNVGRHRLGLNHVFRPKASALAEELKFSMPALNVTPFVNKAQEVNLRGLDLIIDATGEESFGHWIAKAACCPLLHVWIEGAGVAVRTLTKQHAGQGCYRCLSEHNREGGLVSVAGGPPSIFAGHGCEGLYVPFPASVSIQAAALALDAALAWVGGKPRHSLMTRLTDTNYERATPDCSPLKRLGCPVCNS